MKTFVFMITNRCNLACSYCYAEGFRGAPSGGLEGVRDRVHEVLRALLIYRPSRIVFGGGEPLARSDLFSLLAFAARATSVKLLTNGTLLTPEIASRLRDCGVGSVGISLDSARPGPHNRLRSGSHDAARRGIGHCLDAGLPVDLMVTVSRENAAHVMELLAAARDMGVERVTVSDLVLQGRGAERASDLMLDAAGTETFLETLAGNPGEPDDPTVDVYIPQWVRWNRGGTGCQVGKSLLALRPDGTILPCTQLPVALGNILQDDLRDVWNGRLMENLRQARRGPCADCAWRRACGGCRGKALAAGDLFGSDPSCLLALGRAAGLHPCRAGCGPVDTGGFPPQGAKTPTVLCPGGLGAGSSCPHET